MNILLITGLVLFASIFVIFYLLFITNSVTVPEEEKEVTVEDAIERCQSLYNQNLHAELQRFAQKELAKNYGNVELRRILAKSFLASGKNDMAIMHYEAVLSIAPYDIETQEFLANFYREHGSKKRAIDLYEQIFMYDSGNINAVETLANLYTEVQDYQKAIEMYEMMVSAETNPDSALQLKYTLADLYLKTNAKDKAYSTFREIYEYDSENLEIINTLADLAYGTGYYKDCLNYYNKIIELTGGDINILDKTAQLYVHLEQWEQAAETYKKIISSEDETNPNFLYHQNELCNAMIKSGRTFEAIDKLKDLSTTYSKETAFAFTLAQAYSVIGEYGTGIKIYKKLLDDFPVDQRGVVVKYISSIMVTWAKDLFEKGEYNRAFDKFFEALKHDEENDLIYYELGRCNYKIKSFQDSIAHFKKAISIKPGEAKYYFALGCAHDEAGNIKAAKSAFKDALNIDPLYVQSRIAYAIMLTKELEYAQSIEQFNEVLKQVPNDADTTYNIALAYELVGDVERAIRYYKQALDADHGHKEAKHNLELILGEPYEIEYDEIVDENPEVSEVIEQEPVQEAPEASLDDFDFGESTNGDFGGSMFG